MEKGADENGGERRNVSRVRESEKRRSSGKAIEVENRSKKQDACCGRTEKEAVFPLSFFFLSRGGKRIGK